MIGCDVRVESVVSIAAADVLPAMERTRRSTAAVLMMGLFFICAVFMVGFVFGSSTLMENGQWSQLKRAAAMRSQEHKKRRIDSKRCADLQR